MAWYPGATKMELQPESDDQPAIRPTQFILHSVGAPWTARRLYEFWRDSTNLESHFGLGYGGDLAQYIGTQTRADANYRANLRPDGSGAVSIETASNLEHTDPWTGRQVDRLVEVGVWLHQYHGLPLRICRSWDEPGYGYHRLFPQWSTGGTACPGDARVGQFHDVIFPAIVARASGRPDDAAQPAGAPRTLGEYSDAPAALVPGAWTTLSVNGEALISGAKAYTATVFLTVTVPAGSTLQGRFYHQRADGSRWNGPIVERIATVGASFVDFTHQGSVSEGESVRFEACYDPPAPGVRDPGTVSTSRARGLYWT
ncbi:peptidoglycan recognition protein family protein [Streptomyces sp. URMC 124]|uniref:peptidoglycan recognition protein family protein n=1 Tax=Streptomyces sp. URMC 124 TaxID=3423405 RepID=UPI003F1D6515